MNSWYTMKATLYLDDGTQFVGQLFGAAKSVVGEIVFQTGMVGYVESLTDPSYARQFLTLTYPLIGNYGVPSAGSKDELGLPARFESERVWPAALIVDRLCADNEYSHWEATRSLSEWLNENGVPGLAGIDVRELTKKIRETGAMKAKLIIESDEADKLDFVDINAANLVAAVSRKEPATYGNGPVKILAVDCGIKNNQIRCLVKRGTTVKVVPWNHPLEKEIANHDAIFLSNGPGDPEMCKETVENLKKVLSSCDKPIFGICLGNQLLARAAGASTYKLRYGNRGHNQPCGHEPTGRCFITSQNHGYAVDASQLPDGWIPLFTNRNDSTNEGIVHKIKPFFSVQFHPEHTAGPTDCEFLFDIFLQAVSNYKQNNHISISDLITQKLEFKKAYNPQAQKKVLVLGSGGLTIGQAGEFDYSGAQALKALKEEGVRTVLINPNIATVQTSKGFADHTYFLPITKEYVTDVIKKERPTGILVTFGGQTALNCAVDLYKEGVFEKYGVEVLGTPITAIMNTEDREKFNEEINQVGEEVAPSKAANTLQEALQAAHKLGYPVLVRAAFALGGLGSGFAANDEELTAITNTALNHSNQVLIDKSLKGWKEVEYEVVRDGFDNCVTVCNMENVDPLGIHTGESVVVAPSQTLSDLEYNMLRTCAIKVIRHFGIIGECNIQYALDPNSLKYYIIEVNARLSRSSALASKATGYPLAYIAAKLALGHRLPELKNNVTGTTTACFEPSLDYCVVKCPRWDLGKFSRVSTQIGSSMKSVGEVMGIGRSFEEAFQKALRMVSDSADGFSPFYFPRRPVDEDISKPTDKRMFALARGMYYGDFDVEKAWQLSRIDKWFLMRMHNIIDIYQRLEKHDVDNLSASLLLEAKQAGFSDKQISKRVNSTESKIRELRMQMDILPCVKQIDTVAGEWPAQTNYLFVTYNGKHNDVNFDMKNSVIVLGSGVYRIGSSVEFDASCVGCVRELKALGYETIMINCNPETVSTDYDICDRLYFEEISFETVFEIYQKERPKGLILAFGGQAPNNIALTLSRAQVTIFGTSPDSIDSAEDRYKFSRKLEGLKIAQPPWKKSDNIEDAKLFCSEVGYPCLIRPSYVLSGAAMNVAHNADDLASFLQRATVVAKEHPVVVSKFISEAKEIDVDAVAYEGKVLVMAVSEHVENAGIHSGDATLVTPPQDLNKLTLERITDITYRIAECFNVNGPFNMQLIAKDNELRVIECNLRVSRSFPFVSKTLDFDFVALATRAMMAADNPSLKHSLRAHGLLRGKERVGVKVPQFSFSRLAGADVMLGVEMSSTGEVACFGKDRYEAYLKALLSTGFVVPPTGSSVFLSVGGYHAKAEMLRSVQTLQSLGFQLYGSKGTADYFQSNNIHVKSVEWPFDKGIEDAKTSAGARTLIEFFEEKSFQLVINLPIRGKGAYRVSAFRTHGYMTRRMAIDSGIPLITDIKCAKIFVEALRLVGRHPPVNSQIDCIASRTLKRLPGLVDVHVHVREPGATHKEDWTTCTQAALAGGITQILAMPNTQPPLTDEQTYELADGLAKEKALVDYALYIGATANNSEEAAKLASKAAGLKMYLNDTFSALKMDSINDWVKHLKAFPLNRPVVCHAEKETLAAILFMAQLANRPVHICHVARKEEIELIVDAKKRKLPVTCEVAPHHLFLTQENLPEGVKEVRPKLGTQADVDALWSNLDYIDMFATDHAPHTWEEKCGGVDGNGKIPPGFPGVEYMLPLLITAVHQGKLTMRQLIERLHTNPIKIFGLPPQPDTYIEVDMNEEWTIPKRGGRSKAGWTPFAGMKLKGRVVNVVIRGEEVYAHGVIIAEPGFGKNLRTDAFFAQGKSPETRDAFGSVMRELRETVADKNALLGSSSEGSPIATPPRPATPIDPVSLTGRHLVSVLDLTKSQLSRIFAVADSCRQSLERRHSLTHVLQGYVLGSMFYEPSTRTSCSFESAMLRLGGTAIKIDAVSSSVTKGESLEDTVRMMCGYSDILVLRHNEKGAAERGCKVSKLPLINAGDGAGEHPTQALLDIYTIRCENSTVNGLTIAMVGDLKHGRTVHSLAKLLCVYEGITLHYVSPNEELGMPQDVTDYVSKHSNFTQKKFSNLAEGIHHVDVVYVTRIQKERFANPDDYAKVKGSYVITAKLLNDAACLEDEENESILVPRRNRPVVMHPLPRVNEISTELDGDERAAYFRQAENGVFVRMAILALLLGRAAHITEPL